MIKFSKGYEKVLLLIIILLFAYLILCSKTFSKFLRTFSTFSSSSATVPIGAGWSFYLNKKIDAKKLIQCPYVGLLKNGRWGAGTLIKDITTELQQQNMSLPSHPSVEDGTLGGWIASGSHGTGGKRWKPNFGNIHVKNIETGEISDIKYNKIFNDDTPIDICRKHLILDVEVHPVEDVWTKKIAFKMLNTQDARSYLSDDSYLCMMQIGSRGTMILMWVPLSEEDDLEISHIDPHFGSQFGLWFQADILSILQSSDARNKEWFNFPVEPAANYTSKVKLSDANRFTIEPPTLFTPIGLAFINFEVFVYMTISAEKLYELCNAISDLFTTDIRGRLELRGGYKKLFLDFVVLKHTEITFIFTTLLQILGPQKIRLHKGKAQVNTFPFITSPPTE
tara:strand:+ start:813 stop:1994 length:1182 start_codon:yes stop_codon:yes gene_type:complete